MHLLYIISTIFPMMNIFICLQVSAVCGVYASIYVFFTRHDPFIKMCESKLGLLQLIDVYGLRTIHYSLGVFLISYPFFSVIHLTHDLIVACLIVAICLQWIVVGGCILIIWEKRILIPKNVAIAKMPFLALLGVPKKITDLSDNFIVIPLLVLLLRIVYSLYYV